MIDYWEISQGTQCSQIKQSNNKNKVDVHDLWVTFSIHSSVNIFVIVCVNINMNIYSLSLFPNHADISTYQSIAELLSL